MSNRETGMKIPRTELFIYDESTGKSKPLSDEWSIPVHIVGGGIGGESLKFLHGTTSPNDEEGSNEDVYLNSSNGDLYKKENDSWVKIMNLVGATGAKGDTGATGATGANGNDGADGKDGFGTEEQYNDIISRLETLETP